MEVDPDIAIRSTIRPGSVFYFAEEQYTSKESHYFVVINHNPLSDQALILIGATTQIEKRIKWADSNGVNFETMVGVEPKDCPALKEYSLFDCNFPILRAMDSLVEKLRNHELRMCEPASEILLASLRKAMLSSTLVEGTTKRLITGADG